MNLTSDINCTGYDESDVGTEEGNRNCDTKLGTLMYIDVYDLISIEEVILVWFNDAELVAQV